MQHPNTEKLQRYIRITGERGEFVEFDFSIGDPELFVEMIMPRPAFEDFCREQKVKPLTPEQARLVDEDMNKWHGG